MTQAILTVILKGEDWTFKKKFLVYEPFKNDEDDELVKRCIDDAKDCLKITAEDAEFKTSKIIS